MLWAQERVEQFVSRRHDELFLRADAWERRTIHRWLADFSGASLLDAPCGYGRLFPAFEGCASSIVGIDGDPGLCAEATRFGATYSVHTEIRCGDLTEMDLPRVDVAVCVRFWSHLDLSLADGFLGKLVQVAGVLILQFAEDNPGAEASAIRQEGRLRLDRPERIAECAAKRGASLVRVERLAPDHSATALAWIECRECPATQRETLR